MLTLSLQAYEAALSEIAFSGARRIALAQIPFLTYNGECFLSTVTFQYPEPIPDGTLDRVLKNGTVRVGEVAADVNSGLAPWYDCDFYSDAVKLTAVGKKVYPLELFYSFWRSASLSLVAVRHHVDQLQSAEAHSDYLCFLCFSRVDACCPRSRRDRNDFAILHWL